MPGRPRIHEDQAAARAFANRAAAERARFEGRRSRSMALRQDAWEALRRLRNPDERSDVAVLERLIFERAR